jgi:hypothetical protein
MYRWSFLPSAEVLKLSVQYLVVMPLDKDNQVVYYTCGQPGCRIKIEENL